MTTCEYCGAKRCDCEERIHCRDEGKPGHRSCGVCPEHKKPRFLCGCLAPSRTEFIDYDHGGETK